MKKLYIKPVTETVNVRLISSVLEDPGPADWSNGTDELGAKEQGDFFDFDNDTLGDIWGEGESNDLWND